MSENKKVQDFNGNLIPKNKARKIDGYYYEEGKTCIKMPDGKWYRINTNKIMYDWETKEYIFANSPEAQKLVKGLVDDGSLGFFTASNKNVKIRYKKDQFVRQFKVDLFNTQNIENLGSVQRAWANTTARTSEIAEKYGYQESYNDGIFWRIEDCNNEEKARLTVPGLPSGERSNTYSMDDDPNGKKTLEETYAKNDIKIEASIKKLSKFIPYTFGLEFESCIGFVPARVRDPLGFRNLRDGSISGVEYVTIPLGGPKGLQTVKLIAQELSKRCDTNNQCSVHVHFGNVARDKASILALWQLVQLIQTEVLGYFPWSRTNSIRNDGKVYCKPLPNLHLNFKNLFSLDKKSFHEKLKTEFGKIYAFLNNERPLGEQYEVRMERETKVGKLGANEFRLWRNKQKVYVYSTKNKQHSIRGNKWERPQRYYWMNLLPTFFSNAETIEWRPHEATFSFEKTAMWMLICTSIMEYAKNNIKHCLTANKISLKEVLDYHLPKDLSNHIQGYLNERASKFKTPSGKYKDNWEKVESDWLSTDKKYTYNNKSIETIL